MSTKCFLIACLLLALIPSSVLSQDVNVNVNDLMTFNKWRFQNKRIYTSDDEQIYRQQVFFQNLKKINEHKQNKTATYDIGLNQFSDMTDDEFSQRILNPYLSQSQTATNKRADHEDLEEFNPPRGAGYSAPQSVDWRTKGSVGPVKNQGQCGSCWTFATAGVLETANHIRNRQMIQFSEQQILDCVNPQVGFRSNGCRGGFPVEGLQYAQRYGIVTAQQLPYYQQQYQCRVNQRTNGFYPGQVQKVGQSVEALKNALLYGAVAVAVDASSWNSYRGGVFNYCGYTQQNQLNHAVTLIGYDAYGNWIIKNSYGAQWGENGYIRLAPGNTCGILYDNYIALHQ